MKKKLIIFLCVSHLLTKPTPAQITVHLIKPEKTQKEIYTVHGDHEAVSPSGTAQKNLKNKLVIAFPGTNVKATGFNSFDSILAMHGYYTISMDYVNKIATPTFGRSSDSLAFDKFRQEVIFGTPVCDSLVVDSANSLYNRTIRLVQYLAKAYPSENWQQFIKGNSLNWKKVILSGHSQGSGAAAYLAHFVSVNKVLLLAGPQDFRITFKSPANWTVAKSKTSKKRYYALLHINDPNSIKNQLKSMYNLTGLSDRDTININGNQLPMQKHLRILITNIESNNPHGVVTTSLFKEQWLWLLD